MPTPGLLFVRARITSELSEERFNEWYDKEHIPAFLSAGLGVVALRYKNQDETGYPYCALYRTADIASARDPANTGKLPQTSKLLPGSGKVKDSMDFKVIGYDIIQRFEGQGHQTSRGKALLSVGIEPTHAEDFDEWHRKQHLDMLSLGEGYIRSTRYQKCAGEPEAVPTYLSLHEYEKFPLPDTTLVKGTEWSKKQLSEVKSFEREEWALIFDAGGDKL